MLGMATKGRSGLQACLTDSETQADMESQYTLAQAFLTLRILGGNYTHLGGPVQVCLAHCHRGPSWGPEVFAEARLASLVPEWRGRLTPLFPQKPPLMPKHQHPFSKHLKCSHLKQYHLPPTNHHSVTLLLTEHQLCARH